MTQAVELNARAVALLVLYDIDVKGAYAHIALNNYLRRLALDKRDRSLATELVYGTLRRRLTVDWVVRQFSRRPLSRLSPWVLNNLRLGVYQILFLDSIPAPAATNEAVELAKRFGPRGSAGFVNGVLRSLVRNPERADYRRAAAAADTVKRISLLHSHPTWLVETWVKAWGAEETEKLCAANNQVPPTVIRTNTLQISREKLLQELEREGITARPTVMAPEGLQIEGFPGIASLRSFQQGHFVVQDESSMLAAHVLAPRPGETVYDLCAGLGGKTLHLAQLMQNRGRIIAFDRHASKLTVLQQTAERLGVHNVQTVARDVTQPDSRYNGQANRVLLDTPCSGWGVLRRKPDIRWRTSAAQVKELVQLQRSLLEAAYIHLARGGRLVYSTCTLNPAENEANVEWMRRKHPDLIPLTVTNLLFTEKNIEKGAESSLASSADLKAGGEFIQGPTSSTGSTLTLFPHRHGTDGFFIAVWEKR